MKHGITSIYGISANVCFVQLFRAAAAHLPLPVTYPLYMKETRFFIDVSVKRPHICIKAMGRHINSSPSYGYNYRAVIKALFFTAQLNNISRLHACFIRYNGIWPTDLFPTRKLYKYVTPVQLAVLSELLL